MGATIANGALEIHLLYKQYSGLEEIVELAADLEVMTHEDSWLENYHRKKMWDELRMKFDNFKVVHGFDSNPIGGK